MPKPVIAAVNGVAAGAGAGLAFACDFRIAAQGASFLMAFARVGLAADTGVSWTLPRLAGAGRAAELLMLAEPIRAPRALELGLVNQVVEDADLPAAAGALAARLAAGPTAAYAGIKEQLNYAAAHGLAEALEKEAEVQAALGRTADHRAATLAFTRKQEPTLPGPVTAGTVFVSGPVNGPDWSRRALPSSSWAQTICSAASTQVGERPPLTVTGTAGPGHHPAAAPHGQAAPDGQHRHARGRGVGPDDMPDSALGEHPLQDAGGLHGTGLRTAEPVQGIAGGDRQREPDRLAGHLPGRRAGPGSDGGPSGPGTGPSTTCSPRPLTASTGTATAGSGGVSSFQRGRASKTLQTSSCSPPTRRR